MKPNMDQPLTHDLPKNQFQKQEQSNPYELDLPTNCPPQDSERRTVTVYRFVSTLPPSMQDFAPTICEADERAFTPGEEYCIAHSTSVFTNIQDAEKRRRRYKKFRNKFIAKGTIDPTDGPIKQTFSDSHHSWWIETDTPHIKFGEVK